ncbi:MAG: hypothetical protein FD189_1099 [Elusimicrobia bacterium]|nr:MAG: hypothetical protein FD189_1099 [Elusimicrobiota bacterium]
MSTFVRPPDGAEGEGHGVTTAEGCNMVVSVTPDGQIALDTGWNGVVLHLTRGEAGDLCACLRWAQGQAARTSRIAESHEVFA